MNENPLSLFCEDTFRKVFGESAQGSEAPDRCERCKGSKTVTLFDTYMGDADQQPCPDCADGE